MSFDWDEYLNLAKELAKEAGPIPCDEARARASVSRAYYAVFHNSLSLIEKYGGLPKDQISMHSFVKTWFFDKGRKIRALKEIGELFKNLKDDREHADYHGVLPPDSLDIDNEKAVQVIVDSEEAIRKIKHFNSLLKTSPTP